MAVCNLELEGFRVAVTSSSAGIGLGTATVMGRCGARVVITGRREERLRSSVEKLRGMGIEAYGVRSDFSVEGEAARFIRESVNLLGGLDTLVFVPPQPPGGRFSEIGMDKWRLSYRLLVESALEAIYEALPHLERGRSPSIIVSTSVAAWEPIPGIATSSVLRPALHGLVTLLARELAPRGVRVNGVVPGYFMTDRLREVAEMRAKARGVSVEEELRRLEAEVPLGRAGSTEEIGWVIAFLASPRSSYVTGALVPVTGGLHRSIR
ncbi:MAG: SDR family oxidoreductase [Desulfurococcales archaeon]|nr:SDR family oxidoreductase [Desulfurococcales archaeon]